MIQLIGPGGAGKTTTGAALGKRLGVRFIDLDAEFTATYGDISAYLGTHGYAAYAERNVRLYSDLVGGPERPDVVALSSGFMTYQPDRKTGKVQTWSVPKESQTDATEASFVSPAFSHADGRVWVNNADRAQIFRLEPNFLTIIVSSHVKSALDDGGFSEGIEFVHVESH